MPVFDWLPEAPRSDWLPETPGGASPSEAGVTDVLGEPASRMRGAGGLPSANLDGDNAVAKLCPQPLEVGPALEGAPVVHSTLQYKGRVVAKPRAVRLGVADVTAPLNREREDGHHGWVGQSVPLAPVLRARRAGLVMGLAQRRCTELDAVSHDCVWSTQDEGDVEMAKGSAGRWCVSHGAGGGTQELADHKGLAESLHGGQLRRLSLEPSASAAELISHGLLSDEEHVVASLSEVLLHECEDKGAHSPACSRQQGRNGRRCRVGQEDVEGVHGLGRLCDEGCIERTDGGGDEGCGSVGGGGEGVRRRGSGVAGASAARARSQL
eukprot:scaffold26906_cov101-Isochrysis_galbana.AAC.4